MLGSLLLISDLMFGMVLLIVVIIEFVLLIVIGVGGCGKMRLVNFVVVVFKLVGLMVNGLVIVGFFICVFY